MCSAASNHTETHDDFELKDLMEIAVMQSDDIDEETKHKTLDIMKNSGILEAIQKDPDVMNNPDFLDAKLRDYIDEDGNKQKVAEEEKSTAAPVKEQKTVIKNETPKVFDICSVFTMPFFIGVISGLIFGTAIGAGLVMYLKRGKTNNYSINKPKPTA